MKFKMILSSLLLVFVFCCSSFAFSQTTPTHSADRPSLPQLESRLQKGEQSPYLYLATAFLHRQKGEKGKAMQRLEQGLLLFPRDSALREARGVLQQELGFKNTKQRLSGFLAEKIFGFYGFVRFAEQRLLLLCVLGFVLLWALVVFLRRKRVSYGALLVFILWAFLFAGYWMRFAEYGEGHRAVVLFPEVEAYQSYLSTEKIILKLSEGESLRVIDSLTPQQSETWLRIENDYGQKAWVKAEQVGVI